MDAEKDGIMKAVWLKEPLDDYSAKAGGHDHRYACSGIDGVTFGPSFGEGGKAEYLYVAYGIYGDTTRCDNDYQVILKYDAKDWWKRLAMPLSQANLHKSGPKAPLAKYFLLTGNTTYGIQNLAYDKTSGNFYAAVYKGKKEKWPNYSLFMIDGAKAPVLSHLEGVGEKGQTLSLADAGLSSEGIRGWNFKWGSTGLCPVGGGYFSTSPKTVKIRPPASRLRQSVSTAGPVTLKLRSFRRISRAFSCPDIFRRLSGLAAEPLVFSRNLLA